MPEAINYRASTNYRFRQIKDHVLYRYFFVMTLTEARIIEP